MTSITSSGIGPIDVPDGILRRAAELRKEGKSEQYVEEAVKTMLQRALKICNPWNCLAIELLEHGAADEMMNERGELECPMCCKILGRVKDERSAIQQI